MPNTTNTPTIIIRTLTPLNSRVLRDCCTPEKQLPSTAAKSHRLVFSGSYYGRGEQENSHSCRPGAPDFHRLDEEQSEGQRGSDERCGQLTFGS
jgi:hypothetical protein